MSLFSKKIGTKQMVPLCRQLATAYDSGIPIIQSLEHVGAQLKDGKTKRVLRSMSDDLRQGTTLGDAARHQSEYLSPFFVNLLESGDRGGHLDIMLKDLAQYYEDRLAMQRHILGLSIIPMVQLAAAWFLGTFAFGMLGVIQGVLAGRGQGGVNAVLNYVDDYLAFQAKAMVVLALIIIIAGLLSRYGVLGWITGLISTYIWPISNVTRKFALARFFRSFALLLTAGISIPRCIESSAAVTANPYIENDLLKAIPAVKEGTTLTDAFARTRMLSPMAREMLYVGEQSGNLEGQMKKVSEYHLAEATSAVQIATRVFGTLILVGIACLIGYIVISFYASLYGGIMDELGI